jgi:hypothetical protein
MFLNYGDVNFFEYGRLVEQVNDHEFNILMCNPYPDKEDTYQFAECSVDIEDSWIDKANVMAYCGLDSKNYDATEYALGCLEYYGAENFGGMSYAYDFRNMDKESIKEILKHRQIASDNLNVEW